MYRQKLSLIWRIQKAGSQTGPRMENTLFSTVMGTSTWAKSHPIFNLSKSAKLTEGAHTFPQLVPGWGNRIAFYDVRDNKVKVVPFAPGGRNVVRVHQTVWQFFENGQLASPPTWSPDGSHLVFAFREAGIVPMIYLASLDGKVKKIISRRLWLVSILGLEKPPPSGDAA